MLLNQKLVSSLRIILQRVKARQMSAINFIVMNLELNLWIKAKKHSKKSENTNEFPSVHFHALESDRVILDIFQPSVIMVYHLNMVFVREIEIYKAENPSKKLKVYFLFYEDSTEVQKFEASVRRENGELDRNL